MQEAALELYTQFNCCVVFLGKELKEKYYKGAPSGAPWACIRKMFLAISDCRKVGAADKAVHALHMSLSTGSVATATLPKLGDANECPAGVTCAAWLTPEVSGLHCRLLQAAAVATVSLSAAALTQQLWQI